jgi:trehalose/maltose hydrolase-like predicted phosphorylase
MARALAKRARILDDIPDFDEVTTGLTDPTWFLREDDFEPALEHELESRFTVANGFIGVRGSLEIPGQASRPRTYVAGLFDTRPGPPSLSSLVPAPQAFPLRLWVDGEPLEIDLGRVLQHVRLLDFRRGIFRSAWKHELPSGRSVFLESLRFTSLTTRNLAVQTLRLRCASPAMVTARPHCLDLSGAGAANPTAALSASTGRVALVCIREVRSQVDAQAASRWTVAFSDYRVKCQADFTLMSLTSYGLAERSEDAEAQAKEALRQGKHQGLPRLYSSHAGRWQERWRSSDVVVAGNDAAQQALRFAIFHLNGAVDASGSRASIAARGLTGDGYLGHVFWDTDLFMIPFYTFTWPEAARSILEYRYRTLSAARAKARRLGYRGALYAWESTDTGDEATPPYAVGPRGEAIAIRNGDLEQHISAAVAYGVWQYWQATRDVAFLLRAGAEILLETARFWASRPQREDDGLFHIRNVIGPDEYHEDVDDNAYTNYMAYWNIERGLEIAGLLQRRWPIRWQDLAGSVGLTESELASWRSTAKALHLPRDTETGLLEQFSGYFRLEQVDVPPFPERSAPMDVVLGPERTRRSQVVKQADVLMLMALLPETFSSADLRRNFDYYDPRCGHGSSLSPPVHSLVAARLGRVDLAESYFHQTADIDLSNSMGNSAAGLHMGALGGLWQAAVFGFGGIAQRADGLHLSPRLPAGWDRLEFPLQWRQRRLVVDVSREEGRVQVTQVQGRPMRIWMGGDAYRLQRGRPLDVLLPPWEEGPQ